MRLLLLLIICMAGCVPDLNSPRPRTVRQRQKLLQEQIKQGRSALIHGLYVLP